MCILVIKIDSLKKINVIYGDHFSITCCHEASVLFSESSCTNGSPWTGEPLGSIAVRSSFETMHLRVRSLFGIAK